MVWDIIQFLFIYVIQLVGFSIFGAMCFFHVQEFSGFYETVQIHFHASFGDYDLSMFDAYEDRPLLKYFGHAYIILYLFINLLLLLNMVIAMMADTYAQMAEVKMGLYKYQILRIMP